MARDNDHGASVSRLGRQPGPLQLSASAAARVGAKLRALGATHDLTLAGLSGRVGDSGQYIDQVEQLSAGSWRIGRAYRAGGLVCGCVHVTVSVDERLGLTQHERRMVGVRFHEPVDDDLRNELTELACRRGTASHRAAERIAPIELVIEDPPGEHERVIGGLRPPQRRHGQLREIVFGLREPEWMS